MNPEYGESSRKESQMNQVTDGCSSPDSSYNNVDGCSSPDSSYNNVDGCSSPDSSYNNVGPECFDDGREPPPFPEQLQTTVVNNTPRNRDDYGTLPSPKHETIYHLYTDTFRRDPSAEAVALSSTERFQSKYVTVVLYKAASPRRGRGSGRNVM